MNVSPFLSSGIEYPEDALGIWKHNADEFKEKEFLYSSWRRLNTKPWKLQEQNTQCENENERFSIHSTFFSSIGLSR